MGLGPDNAICKTEFVEAMRARLMQDDPELGATVDKPGAQKTLGAQAEAVYQIATVHAESFSDAGADAAFWQWMADLEEWLHSLSDWQSGVRQAFQNWAPVTPAEQNVRASLLAVPSPGAVPSPPDSLQGKIR
jgi:hypothetical protein